MKDIKLIAFDLDGTMLDEDKNLPEENRRALLEAVDKGIYIVPVTGRLPVALPRSIAALPVRYGIFSNGAEITDLQTGQSIGGCLVDWQQAVEIFAQADAWPIIYDCYMENKAYMSQAFRSRIPDYAVNEHYLKMMFELRIPVPELKEYLTQRKQGVQKLQFYFRKDQYALREELLHNWKIPGVEVSSSVANNLELNNAAGTKGFALEKLARHLDIPMDQVMALGDGYNDRTMLEKAGLAVAMENAVDSLKAIAHYVTGPNTQAGVAQAIRKFCL